MTLPCWICVLPTLWKLLPFILYHDRFLEVAHIPNPVQSIALFSSGLLVVSEVVLRWLAAACQVNLLVRHTGYMIEKNQWNLKEASTCPSSFPAKINQPLLIRRFCFTSVWMCIFGGPALDTDHQETLPQAALSVIELPLSLKCDEQTLSDCTGNLNCRALPIGAPVGRIKPNQEHTERWTFLSSDDDFENVERKVENSFTVTCSPCFAGASFRASLWCALAVVGVMMSKRTGFVILYTNGSCEVTPWLFETFGRERSCVIEQEPFCDKPFLPRCNHRQEILWPQSRRVHDARIWESPSLSLTEFHGRSYPSTCLENVTGPNPLPDEMPHDASVFEALLFVVFVCIAVVQFRLQRLPSRMAKNGETYQHLGCLEPTGLQAVAHKKICTSLIWLCNINVLELHWKALSARSGPAGPTGRSSRPSKLTDHVSLDLHCSFLVPLLAYLSTKCSVAKKVISVVSECHNKDTGGKEITEKLEKRKLFLGIHLFCKGKQQFADLIDGLESLNVFWEKPESLPAPVGQAFSDGTRVCGSALTKCGGRTWTEWVQAPLHKTSKAMQQNCVSAKLLKQPRYLDAHAHILKLKLWVLTVQGEAPLLNLGVQAKM